MRTLKKTLCVVLCLAMLVGLCAMGASAIEFTDADEINYKEAVDLLTGIGVINGKPDGDALKFDPKGTLTRAEACKIITYLLGYEDISATSTFDDVPAGKWFSGPIALCATEGIVNGVGNNKFNPNGTLTGSAWSKMLLCALGYNAEYEGMTGKSWEVGVAKTLKNTGLLDGIDGFDQAADITRETAAQMAFNALSETTRKFKEGMKISGDNINVSANGEYDGTYPGTSLGVKNFGLAVAAGDLNPAVGVIDGVPDTSGQKYSTIGANKYAQDFGADAYGRLYKIYYKTAAPMPAGGYTVYSYEDITVEVEITAAMTKEQVKAAFKAAGITGATVGAGYDVIQNGVGLTGGAGALITLGTDDGAAVGAGTFYINATAAPFVYAKKVADQDIKVVSKVTAYTAPTAKAAGTITLAGVTAAGEIGGPAAPIALEKIGSETPDKVDLYDGIKVDDYVYVTKVVAGVGTMKVEKATIVEGAATSAYTTGAVAKATVGGTEYTVVGAVNRSITANATAVGGLGLTAPAAGDVGATLRNYVLTADGKLLGSYAYTAASNANDYAMIVGLQWKAGTAADLEKPATYAKVLVKVLLADGTIDVYSYTSQSKLSVLAGTADTTVDGFYEEVEKLVTGGYTDGMAVSPLAVGNVIKYAAADKVFSEAHLLTEALVVDNTAGNAPGGTDTAGLLTAKTAKVAEGVFLTATTPVIYYKAANDTAKVVTGYSDVQAATAAQAFFVTDANDKVVCVFVNNAYVPAATVTNTVAYIPAAIAVGAPDATKYDETLKANVYGYNMYIDGELTTLWGKTTMPATAAGFIEYTVTDGYLSNTSAAPAGLTAVAGTVGMVDATNIDIGGNQYALGSVKIITHDKNGTPLVPADDTISAGGTLAAAQSVTALYKAVAGVDTLQYIAIIIP